MLMGRHILLAGALGLLSACAETVTEAAPILAGQGLFVSEITVDTDAVTPDMTGDLLTAAQVGSDLQTRLAVQMGLQSDPAGTPVSVAVVVTDVSLITALEGAIPGAKSRISGTVSVADADPVVVVGVSERFRVPGVLGVITAPDRQTDYDETASGFAKEITDAVF